MAESSLKHLGFIPAYATSATGVALNVYHSAKGLVPFAEPYVQQLETTAITMGMPYATIAQDTLLSTLTSVDAKVDQTLGAVNSALSYGRELHSKNLATFNEARDLCFGYVSQAKAALDPSPYVQWVSEKASVYVNPDKLVEATLEVAAHVASFGPVPKVLETADPLIKIGEKAYSDVHDAVVSLPAYKKLWDLVWSTSSSVQDSWAYKKAVSVSYPVLAPLADPVVSNITNSRYLKQLQSHLAPAKAL